MGFVGWIHLRIDLLKFNVQSCAEVTYDVKDDKVDKRCEASEKLYDTKGNRLVYAYFDSSGERELLQKTTFSEGRKTGFINFDEEDNQIGSRVLKFDEIGRVIAKYYNGELSESYEYHNNNTLLVVSYANAGQDIFEYDSSGLVVKQLTISNPNSITRGIFGGFDGASNQKVTLYKNDKYGNVLKMETFDNDSGKLLFSQQNEINEYGDEIKSIGFNGDGTIYSQMLYEKMYVLR